MTKIKLFDAFAWVWGFHIWLSNSIWKENVELIWFSEIDKFAKQTYLKNFPGSKDFWDIKKIDIVAMPDIDILTGWFPCQDVSVAWKQNLDWWRTILVEYLLRILEEKKPRYFIFENVRWFLSKKFQNFRESIFERIEEAWYNFRFDILNTKDYWLPQNRERVFIVWVYWYWNNFYTIPEKQELEIFLKDILEENVDECFFLSKKQYDSLSFDSLKRVYEDISPTLTTSEWWHRQPKIRIKNATKKGYIEMDPGDWIALDNPNSKTKRSRVKKWLCWTLTCNDFNWVMWEDYKIRKLTPLEYERLQGFPYGWTEWVSNTQRYKQMGNAVSVPVVENIFNNLLKTRQKV